VLVHPVAEGVRLDLHPEVLVTFDGHAARRVTLGTPGHHAHLTKMKEMPWHVNYVRQKE
jgi:hypothetical protein